MTREFRGCIAQDNVHERNLFFYERDHCRIIDVPLDGLNTRKFSDRIKIYPKNLGRREGPLYLEPAPGGRPEVDNIIRRPDNREFFLNLHKFVRGTRAVSLVLCPQVSLVLSPL